MLREDIVHVNLPVKMTPLIGNQIRYRRFIGVSYYPRDAGQHGNFLGCPLGITARHQDPRVRVFPVRSAHGLAQILIGRRRHGAAIQDDQIGGTAITGLVQTTLAQ